MFKAIFTVIVAVVVVGCSKTEMRKWQASLLIPKIPAWSEGELCSSYDHFNPFVEEAVRNEVQKRSLLNQVDREYLPRRRFTIGSSECGVFAVWGDPKDKNVTVVGSGKRHIQYVFNKPGTDYGHRYVYFENGVVTAWQE